MSPLRPSHYKLTPDQFSHSPLNNMSKRKLYSLSLLLIISLSMCIMVTLLRKVQQTDLYFPQCCSYYSYDSETLTDFECAQ